MIDCLCLKHENDTLTLDIEQIGDEWCKKLQSVSSEMKKFDNQVLKIQILQAARINPKKAEAVKSVDFMIKCMKKVSKK